MKLIPVPRGMSYGFYAFMGAGCPRSDSGEIMMLADEPATPSEPIRWASIGDVIECHLQTQEKTLRVKLTNAESCAFANELILRGRWRVVESKGS